MILDSGLFFGPLRTGVLVWVLL